MTAAKGVDPLKGREAHLTVPKGVDLLKGREPHQIVWIYLRVKALI